MASNFYISLFHFFFYTSQYCPPTVCFIPDNLLHWSQWVLFWREYLTWIKFSEAKCVSRYLSLTWENRFWGCLFVLLLWVILKTCCSKISWITCCGNCSSDGSRPRTGYLSQGTWETGDASITDLCFKYSGVGQIYLF